MADKQQEQHPDLDQLVDLDEGLLDEALLDEALLDEGLLDEGLPATELERLKSHLAACPSCRLELKRLRQFNTADQDPGVLAETDWDRAELPLQRAFERKIRPASRSGRGGGRWWVRLAPVAAAAVLAVVALNFDWASFRSADPVGEDPLRGGEPTRSLIILELPSEDVPAVPSEFIWGSESEFDSYILEVFTPDLEPVFRMTDLRETCAVIPDSLQAMLLPGQTYLWNVQGQSGLADAELSLTAWFRIVKVAIGKI